MSEGGRNKRDGFSYLFKISTLTEIGIKICYTAPYQIHHYLSESELICVIITGKIMNLNVEKEEKE